MQTGVGILPCKPLSYTSSTSSFFKRPISVGTLPVMLFPESQIFRIFVNKPISEGILPEREQSVAENVTVETRIVKVKYVEKNV